MKIKLMKIKLLYLTLLLFPIFGNAAGVPTSFTYQGKALNAAGTAPLTSTVSFTLSITDPSSACILYQETQANVNLATTNGIFALQVGSAIGATKRVSGIDPGLSMTSVFANNGTQLVAAGGSCPGYTPSANDVRKLHVVITPSPGSPITISPDLTINSVPNALVSETVQGFSVQALTQLLNPPGFIMPFAGTNCPTGFVLADGSSLSTTGAYANLFSAIQYTYGGSGSSFSLPNGKGIYLRGTGTQTVNGISYSSGALGSTQNDQLQGHYHSFSHSGQTNTSTLPDSGSPGSPYNGIVVGTAAGGTIGIGSPISDGVSGTPRTGLETRPVSLAINYCVKY